MNDIEPSVLQTLLLDYYGGFLTENQQRAMALRYDEDFSLGEIAGELGITRQGVNDTLKRASQALAQMEAQMGLAARALRMEGLIEQAEVLCRTIDDSALREGLQALLAQMRTIQEEPNGL